MNSTSILVVPLEHDLLAVPAQLFLKQLAIRVHHLMQAANVSLHVGAAGDNLAHVVLHVAAAACPKIAAAAERRNVMEVRVFPLDTLELVAVVDAVLIASAEDQPVFVAAIAFRLLEKPMKHAADGRDARSGGNEYGVLARLAQGEKAVWPMELDRRALREIAQPVGKEALFHAVEAQIERGVRARQGCEGICARVFLAIGPRLLDRDKLPWNEAEFLYPLDAKLEMLGLRREQNRPVQAGREDLPLDGGALLYLGFHNEGLRI